MKEHYGTYKLPILRIFLEAITLPGIHSGKILKFGMPLVAISILYGIYFNAVIVKEQPSLGGFLLLFPLGLLFLASLVMAIVGLHRTFLMPDNEVADTKAFRWTGRETRFVVWWIIIGICTLVIALPIVMIMIPFAEAIMNSSFENSYLTFFLLTVLNMPIYYVISRWMLVFPATAIDDHNDSLRWAWNLSSGNGWRLTFLVSGLPFFMNMIIDVFPYSDPVYYFIFSGIVWLITGTIGVALLSLSYSYLSKNIIHDEFIQEHAERSQKYFDYEPNGPELQD